MLRKDAATWARMIEVQADRVDLPADPSCLKTTTLGDLVRRYKVEKTRNKRGAKVEQAVLSRFLLDPICSLTLANIRVDDFAKFRDQKLKSITPGSLKRQLNPVRNLFEVARLQWGLPIRENPVAKLAFKASDRKRDRRLLPGEFEKLMRSARMYRNPLTELIIRIAVATGMRRGEILSMQWKHVNFAARTLIIPVTKNGHPRTIPLSRNAIASLKKVKRNGEVIFPVKGDALRLAWNRITLRANIDGLRFHDLRHEAISRLFEIGLTTPEVASISGHRDATMLFRYAHADRQRVIKKLDRAAL